MEYWVLKNILMERKYIWDGINSRLKPAKEKSVILNIENKTTQDECQTKGRLKI